MQGPIAATPRLGSATQAGLLGLLAPESTWGYNLTIKFQQRFDQPPLSTAPSRQSLYKALDRMARLELIVPVGGSQPVASWIEDRPRRLLSMTTRGQRALDTWLAAPMSHDAGSLELLIRLDLGATNADIRAMLDRHASACLHELQIISHTHAKSRPHRIIQAERQTTIQARLRWIESVYADFP
jgi:DNA-binding PadR family transcriptional regulator